MLFISIYFYYVQQNLIIRALKHFHTMISQLHQIQNLKILIIFRILPEKR